MRITNKARPLVALALVGPVTVAISSTSTGGSEIFRTAAAAFDEVPQRNASKAISISPAGLLAQPAGLLLPGVPCGR
jgi:hypothetical protein